jgi:hypothetical protein
MLFLIVAFALWFYVTFFLFAVSPEQNRQVEELILTNLRNSINNPNLSLKEARARFPEMFFIPFETGRMILPNEFKTPENIDAYGKIYGKIFTL